MTGPTGRRAYRNHEIPWDAFDTGAYLEDNYARLHDLDRQIIDVLAPYYAALPASGLDRSVDVGTGPNLYPLMLVAAASRRPEALERSAANLAYLRQRVREGAGAAWRPFWERCRAGNPALPPDFDQVLRRLDVVPGSVLDLPAARYDLVSMFFVAESVTGVADEFEAICRRFAAAAVPGGHLVAAFMAGMSQYRVGGTALPSVDVDEAALHRALAGLVDELRVERLPPDPTLPYAHDGVLLLTGRAAAGDRQADQVDGAGPGARTCRTQTLGST